MWSAFRAHLLLEVDIFKSSYLAKRGMQKHSLVDLTELLWERVCMHALFQGDYGGPLLCHGGSGFVQVGIMSYGSHSGCALPSQPGVFTQVSKYLDYINSYIHQWELCSPLSLLQPHSCAELLWFLLTAYSFFCNKALKHRLLRPLHQFYTWLKSHSSTQRTCFLYIQEIPQCWR